MPPPDIFKPARLSPQYGPARAWLVYLHVQTPIIDGVPIDGMYCLRRRVIALGARSAEEASFLAAIIHGCTYEGPTLEIVDVVPAP
jgi:hypothetical protein